MQIPKLRRRHFLHFMKGFRKIKSIVKPDRICNCCNREIRMFQQIARLFHTKIREVFLWRLTKHGFKGAEQLASAQSYIGGNILHRDMVRIIGRNIFNPFLHIAVSRVLRCVCRCSMHEECKHGIETAGHFHGVFELISSGIINMEDLSVNGFPQWRVFNNRSFCRKIRCL